MNSPNHSIDKCDDFHSSQVLILKAIIYYSNKHGFPPTVRELCDIVGLKSTSTIHSHLNKLEKKGYILKKTSSPRSITITDKVSSEGLYSSRNNSFNINDELESVMKNLRKVINCDDLYIDNIHTKKKTLFGISQLVTDALIKIDSINC